jgi:hypothetical protein
MAQAIMKVMQADNRGVGAASLIWIAVRGKLFTSEKFGQGRILLELR